MRKVEDAWSSPEAMQAPWPFTATHHALLIVTITICRCYNRKSIGTSEVMHREGDTSSV